MYFSAFREIIFFKNWSLNEEVYCFYSLFSIRGICVAYHDHMCEQSVVMMCLGHVL